MTKTKIVNEDGSQIEGEKFRAIYNGIKSATGDKDEIVADIRERFGHAKDKGLNKSALKESLKWAGAGVEAFIDHAATVVQYMYAAQDKAPQLDLFREAVGRPLFRPEEQTAVERAEAALEDGAGSETSTFRPIGEVAAGVVATVGEMVEQNDAEKAAAAHLEVTPDQQMEAKLQGEAAGKQGFASTENPYPVASSLHGWWSKGWTPAYKAWEKENPQVAAQRNGTVTPIAGRARQPSGFKDKTPRMSADQAAKILGGSDDAA